MVQSFAPELRISASGRNESKEVTQSLQMRGPYLYSGPLSTFAGIAVAVRNPKM